MFGSFGYDWTATPGPTLTEKCLSPKHPTSMDEADERIRFVVENFLPGEKAKLYRLFHDVDKIRLDNMDQMVRKMKQDFKKATSKP